ncbi:MAG: nucleoside hydrolase [Candidatus Borkfalkiaceae bacterium]|nr:nucleoside hydrolase [Christensenellaceae bacterium]
MKIWIDTDVGGDIDDALALLLAMSSPETEIVGVSTTFENTYARAEIASSLLIAGGRPDVPVYAGYGVPYRAVKVHGIPVDPEKLPKTYDPALFAGAPVRKENAVDALAERLREEEGIRIVTLGALTNIARLIDLYPDVINRIEGLYIMGGAQKLNLNEFNLTCDPEAASAVFRSPVRKKIVTLDCTFRCKVEEKDVARLAACRSAAVRTVTKMYRLWDGEMYLHDPLALAAATDPGFLTFEKGDLFVETEGEFSRGKCVDLTDFNWNRPGREDMLVSADVDGKAFVEAYVSAIVKWDASLPPEGSLSISR